MIRKFYEYGELHTGGESFSIADYNKRCAEFLNLPRNDEVAIYKMSEYPYDFLKFHSDWNWIMEVVDAIDKIQHTQLDILGKYCRISSKGIDFQGSSKEDKKEAVVKAINQFLIWYNENK